jgi:chorismate dehydratase
MHSRKKASCSYAEIAADAEQRAWMGEQALVEYWQRVSYDLDPLHVEGLRCFYLLLEKNGLIEETPELEFFS